VGIRARPGLCFTIGAAIAFCGGILGAASLARGQNLLVDGVTVEMSGVHYYNTVQVVNGGIIRVTKYDNGPDKTNYGNLQIVANTIFIGEGSGIVADGAGYQPIFCGNGAGPNLTAGGRGGCAVLDSGGGGAHFGRGGRGTRDSPGGIFPWGFEEDCGTQTGPDTCTAALEPCRDGDGLPSVAGEPYIHSIYGVEFGAAGGDRGCLDGDGWSNPCMVAGAGGGRIVLAAVNAAQNGTLDIRGRVSAEGWRGCGNGNDSGGGGAGGSVLLVGDFVYTTASAYISAKGGLGGDTLGTPPDPADPFGQACPACAQQGGTCDDCGGGGGGGIVSVLSRAAAQLDPLTRFDVAGSGGGTCTNGNCIGEAGGGAGELQLNGVYQGELCDGFDSDFDGVPDDNLGSVTCGGGACQVTVSFCDTSDPQNVVPNDCVPLADPLCQAPVSDTRPRFLVIVDTSGSMLLDSAGNFTFGDGSAGHLGLDTNGDGVAGNDSRLYQAKQALTNVISAYVPEIDFGLARYAQGTGPSVNCQLAHWFECAGICCTYDNPVGNTGTNPGGPCAVSAGAAGSIPVLPLSTGDECVNYAGSCGSVRRGADILVGFERPVGQLLMWLDHKETAFVNQRTEGDHCDYAGGGDCELRGTGPTPLADSLLAARAYLDRTMAEDSIAGCRRYAVILLTDGVETCMGEPVSAAAELRTGLGVDTYVIGFSVLSSEQVSLNAIANAGSSQAPPRDAFFAGNENELAAALASIVAESVVFELCNGLDDDCDGQVDEDFPSLGQACDDGQIGLCRGTGTYQCRPDGTGVQCAITNPGQVPTDEVCNGIDDNCNGQIDEGLNCVPPCVPTGPEICDGVDNDCDGAVDEEDPLLGLPCGDDEGQCEPGQWLCAGGQLICVGAVEAVPEMCNGLDDDCDGVADDDAPCPVDSYCIEGACRGICRAGEFPCPGGYDCVSYEIEGLAVRVCMPGACASCQPGEICQDGQCVDPCAGVHCEENEECVMGLCRDCHTLGCPSLQICFEGQCQEDPCALVSCGSEEYCDGGACVPICYLGSCKPGQRCGHDGLCEADPCADVTCPTGELCVEGDCEADICSLVYCAPGTFCIPPGDCVPNPCPLLDCPQGTECRVSLTGDGQCVPLSDRPPDEPILRLTAGGRGGCACDVSRGGAGDPILPVIVLAFFLVRVSRRRRDGAEWRGGSPGGGR
jgi:hypothetical protein